MTSKFLIDSQLIAPISRKINTLEHKSHFFMANIKRHFCLILKLIKKISEKSYKNVGSATILKEKGKQKVNDF